MKNKRLLDIVGEINDSYILEAEPSPKNTRRRPTWVKWGSVAACLCVLTVVGFAVFRGGKAHPAPTASLTHISATESEAGQAEPEKQYPLVSFAATNIDPDADFFGEDELRRVEVILQGNRLYTQLPESKYTDLGIEKSLRESDFGTALGTVTEIGPYHDDVVTTPCSQEPTLDGCEVFLYQPVNCEGMIIVRGNVGCSLFRFVGFTDEGYCYCDEYKVLNVLSADDISKIDYRIDKPDGAMIVTKDEGSVTDKTALKAFFDITISLKPYERGGPLDGDPDWLIDAREEYKEHDANRVFVEATVVLKNGLTMEFSYEPNLGTGYFPGYYFLSEEDNAVLKSMFKL